jgi:hypothetical protein
MIDRMAKGPHTSSMCRMTAWWTRSLIELQGFKLMTGQANLKSFGYRLPDVHLLFSDLLGPVLG